MATFSKRSDLEKWPEVFGPAAINDDLLPDLRKEVWLRGKAKQPADEWPNAVIRLLSATLREECLASDSSTRRFRKWPDSAATTMRHCSCCKVVVR